MGIAEVIPGVSGGTIAFISGIYEQLIDSVKSITDIITEPSLILKPKILWSRISGGFLMRLLVGMILGLIVGVFGISYLLEQYPEPLWGFFFGLILASVLYLLEQIKPLQTVQFLFLVLGAVIALAIVSLTPAEGNASLLMVFFSGTIAICALVLPGISGSFILLLMGMYTVVIPAVKDVLSMQDLSKLSIVLVFILGCILGLTLFTKLLHWLLHKHKKNTFSLMTGFMLGSLYKIWPWRNPIQLMHRDTQSLVGWSAEQFDPTRLQHFRVLIEQNVLPSSYWGQPRVLWVGIALLAGFLSVWLLSRMESS